MSYLPTNLIAWEVPSRDRGERAAEFPANAMLDVTQCRDIVCTLEFVGVTHKEATPPPAAREQDYMIPLPRVQSASRIAWLAFQSNAAK